MENPNITASDGSNINVQHIHKLGWGTTVQIGVLILAVAMSAYQSGKSASADTLKSREYAVLQNHIRDLEAQMNAAQYFQEFKEFLDNRSKQQ